MGAQEVEFAIDIVTCWYGMQITVVVVFNSLLDAVELI